MRNRAPALAVWWCVGALAGCGGGVEDTPGRAPDAGLDPETPESVVAAERSPLRRLTHDEYRATVTDLFGVESAYAARLPREDGAIAFSNDVSGQLVVPFLVQTYGAVARELARGAVADLPTFLGCDPAGDAERACIESFFRAFGGRTFRRPLTDDEVVALVDRFAAYRDDFDVAHSVELMVSRLLQSPHFLYRVEFGAPGAAPDAPVPLTDYELASRLSYLFTGSMPDAALFEAAAAGELQSPDALEAHARRLLEGERAKEVAWRFMREWFDVDRADTITPDKVVFTGFKPAHEADMVTEMRLYMDHVLWEADGTLRTLFTSTRGYLNQRLEHFYGIEGMGTGTPKPVELDPAERMGVLTHPVWLAIYATGVQTDPIRRGKFIREELLCEKLPDPPPDVMATPPEVTAEGTTRDRYQQHSVDPACSGCHAQMDPIGFALENFDPVGRFRTEENGVPIDTSGEILRAGDTAVPLTGFVSLAQWLAESDEVAACATKQWFRYAFGRHETEADEATLTAMGEALAAADGSLPELMISVVRTEAFRHKLVTP